MILLIECIFACLIFGVGIVGSVLYNKEAWLQEYAPAVQKQFIEKNPNYVPKEKSEKTFFLIVAKLGVSLLFALILTILVYVAGARDFKKAVLYSYIIWFVVNWFDAIILDIIVFAKWKRVRLPGTEEMDREYASNAKKSIKDGFIGMVIGIPVACLCGCAVALMG